MSDRSTNPYEAPQTTVPPKKSKGEPRPFSWYGPFLSLAVLFCLFALAAATASVVPEVELQRAVVVFINCLLGLVFATLSFLLYQKQKYQND